jgi:5-methylcytosine-specific restriction endonuclease McrA
MWNDKQLCLPFGLGWTCDRDCQQQAVERKRKRIVAQTARPRKGPSEQSVRTNARNVASPAKRRYIAQRDGGCRVCGTTRDLHCHHITYRSEGGTNDERNLVTVCQKDHDRVHSNKRLYQPALKELIRLHYDDDRFLMLLEVLKLGAT